MVTLPDEIAEQIRKLPDINEFVVTVVKNALNTRFDQKTSSDEFYGILAATDREYVRRITEDKETYYDV